MEETEKSWQETSDSNVSAMEKDGPVPTDEFFQDVQNGGSLSLDIVQQLHFTEQHVGSEEDPSFHGIQYNGSLSPKTEQNLNIIIQNLKSKKAFLDQDEKGRPIIQYEPKSKVFWDASKANMITDCGTDDDVKRNTESFLDSIDYLKTNRPPSGVRYNNEKVHTDNGRYREGYEFEKTEKVLGSGVAGVIVVIKDKMTRMESAQKTILLPFFRKEEVKAMVDLAKTGFPPALYLTQLVGNEVEIYMEIISEAFTIRKIIDDYRMDSSLAKQFSLFVLDSLLRVARAFYDKGWVHRDFHAGNTLIQKKHLESKLIVRIIDFGNAKSFDECQELKFESFRRDIMEIVRIFCALYCGQEFCDALDLQRNWQKWINEVHLAYEDKEELSSLLENAVQMKHFQDVPIFHGLVQEKRQSALPDAQSHDMMRRVLAVLFPDISDIRAIHPDLKENYLSESHPPGVADSVVPNHPHCPSVKHLASSGKTVPINPIDEPLSLSSSVNPE